MLGFPIQGLPNEQSIPTLLPWINAGHVEHDFIHFHLILSVKTAVVLKTKLDGIWSDPNQVRLPKLMIKILRNAQRRLTDEFKNNGPFAVTKGPTSPSKNGLSCKDSA